MQTCTLVIETLRYVIVFGIVLIFLFSFVTAFMQFTLQKSIKNDVSAETNSNLLFTKAGFMAKNKAVLNYIMKKSYTFVACVRIVELLALITALSGLSFASMEWYCGK